MTVIRIENLSVIYGKGEGQQELFSNFNFTLNSGEHVLLGGPNGSGKSTLLDIIFGLQRNYGGVVDVDRESIGYVPQRYRETLLPWLSSEENILFVWKGRELDLKEGKDKLKDLLKLCDPGFPLSRKAKHLSGGQSQIIAILRTLILRPKIIILDEPWSALSNKKAQAMRSLILNYCSESAWIITSHNEVADKCLGERVVTLGEEKICDLSQCA